jgi:hypothetical protein
VTWAVTNRRQEPVLNVARRVGIDVMKAMQAGPRHGQTRQPPKNRRRFLRADPAPLNLGLGKLGHPLLDDLAIQGYGIAPASDSVRLKGRPQGEAHQSGDSVNWFSR